MSSFSLCARGPFFSAFHVCRNGFILACETVVGSAVAARITSVTIAHSGHVGEKFRYAFNQVMKHSYYSAAMTGLELTRVS